MQTKNLTLRKLSLKDIKDLIEAGNDYDIHYKSFFLMKFPFGEKEALEVINEENKRIVRFGIELKKEKKIIGLFDLYNINEKNKSLKIGYWIGKNYRRKGYMSEVLEKTIPWIFKNYKIEKIIASCLISNESSINLLKKFKFKLAKVLKNDRFLEEKYVDSLQFVFEKPRV